VEVEVELDVDAQICDGPARGPQVGPFGTPTDGRKSEGCVPLSLAAKARCETRNNGQGLFFNIYGLMYAQSPYTVLRKRRKAQKGFTCVLGEVTHPQGRRQAHFKPCRPTSVIIEPTIDVLVEIEA